MKKQVLLSGFHSIRPQFEHTQEELIQFLISAHQPEDLSAHIRRFSCPADKISKRGHEIGLDYNFREKTHGDRVSFFLERTTARFHEFYQDVEAAPSDLLHVTCTGYTSPSSAQALVSVKGWHQSTTVTHVYHMGCYAAVPALRIGSGFLANTDDQDQRVDIVHTELCALHLNPRKIAASDLVAQSLFADGFIKYSLTTSPYEKGLKLVTLLEEIVPDTLDSMTWAPDAWGMTMHLAKEIPQQIAAAIPGFVEALFKKAGLSFETMGRECLFAIHPGGPKIIDGVKEILKLSDAQVAHSRQILFDYGNMSSATLPHIWAKQLDDNDVPHGRWIASLAFGPGLTVCGSILRKHAP